VTGHRDATGEPSLGAELTALGRTVTIQTTGRSSGLPRSVTIGFIDDGDGSLLVAASEDASHWARNLIAEPRCRVERAGAVQPYRAVRLEGPDAHAAVAALILKYGTPAERLGGGPIFRLVPSTSTD
jgi:deazaflavin-dependent oxidoreductase (nitroreductase family)